MFKRFILILGILLAPQIVFAIIINKENPVYYFVNHEAQIKTIREKLLNDNVVGITGITGVGKSELVRKYVQEYKDDYAVIAFINAGIDLVPQLVSIAKDINQHICLKEKCNISENPNYVKQSLMQYLKYQDKWLVIFDNLHVNENNKIKEFIEWQNNGHILICSQDTKYLRYKVPVPYLQKQDIISVINKIMNNAPEGLIVELSSAMQDYPTYIIAHSAIFLHNNNHMSVKEYIKNMQKHENKIRAHLDIVLKEMNLNTRELLFKLGLLNNQRIPRYLVEHIIGDNDKASEYIDEIIRFGVMEQINEDRNNQIFRIHDAIKNELLSINGLKLIKNNVDFILDKVNDLIPESVTDRLAVLTHDKLLESNLEILLDNAERYNADVYKVISVGEKLLWYYLIGSRQPHHAKKLVNWFKKNDSKVNINFCTDKDKAAYASYLTYIAGYEYSIEDQTPQIVIGYLDSAEKTIKSLTGYEELQSYIYATKAHVQIAVGDTKNAEFNIQKAERIRPTTLRTFLGANVTEHLKAKILLLKGEYMKALSLLSSTIDQPKSVMSKHHNIKQESTKNILLAPEYITKARILNFMEKYNEAYVTINNNVYNHIKDRKNEDMSVTLLARTLVELSRAELGILKKDEAFKHISEAVNLLIKNNERNNKNLTASKDIYLADALAVKANVLAQIGKYEESIEDYKLSKDIYWNIYDNNNIKNIEDISILLTQGAITALKLSVQKDRDSWSNYFYKLLVHEFGENHPKSKLVKTILFGDGSK